MKKLNLIKLKNPELLNYISLSGVLYLKLLGLLIVLLSEWLLDVVLITYLLSFVLPLWLGIILGIIIGGLFTFPFREQYTNYSFTHLYYRLAFRKDKIMMSLLEEVKEV